VGHTTRNVLIVAVGLVGLVVAAAIAGDSGFALAVGLVLVGLIAMFVPIAVIAHEQRGIPLDPRPPHRGSGDVGGGGHRRAAHPILLLLGGACLVGIGLLIGLAVNGGETKTSSTGALDATSIGNPSVGRHLFVTERCASCHSYEGKGGSDGPPLDYMRGMMSAKDIADMSGQLWNHLPAMERALKEEKIPFPTFSKNEMADLIAYIHGGGLPPDMSGHMKGAQMGGANSGHMGSGSGR
jgi:mono/diheme cytochrome c family protein